MTPSQQARTAGLESLAHVVRISGVSQRTLINWHKSKPQLFAVVLAGCAAKNEQRNSIIRCDWYDGFLTEGKS